MSLLVLRNKLVRESLFFSASVFALLSCSSSPEVEQSNNVANEVDNAQALDDYEANAAMDEVARTSDSESDFPVDSEIINGDSTQAFQNQNTTGENAGVSNDAFSQKNKNIDPMVAAPTNNANASESVVVKWVGHEYDKGQRKVHVQIACDRKPRFAVFQEYNKKGQAELVVRFYNSSVARSMRRPLDSSEFKSPVAYIRVRSYSNFKDNDVVLTIRDEIKPVIYAKEGSINISFDIPEKYLAPTKTFGPQNSKITKIVPMDISPQYAEGSDLAQPMERQQPYQYVPNSSFFKQVKNGELKSLAEGPYYLKDETIVPETKNSTSPKATSPVENQPLKVPSAEPIPEAEIPDFGAVATKHIYLAKFNVISEKRFYMVAQDSLTNNEYATPQELIGRDNEEAMQAFKGKDISLDFDQAPLGMVLKTFAEDSGVNFVISQEINQTPVSMKLSNVPWDQALKAILETYGLGMVRVGENVIRVDRVDQMSSYLQRMDTARQFRSASTPTKVLVMRLKFANLAEISGHVQRILTSQRDVRFSVASDNRTNSLIVEATPSVLARVKTLVERLDYRTPQIEIVTRQVKMQNTNSNFLGIAWSTAFNFDQGRGLSFGSLGGYPSSVNSAVAVDPGVFSTTRVGTMDMQIGSINNFVDLGLTLRLEEQKGNVEVVDTSRNVVLDRDSAQLSSGRTDYFITQGTASTIVVPGQVGAAGGGAAAPTQINYRNSINVTPSIVGDQMIQLSVAINSVSPSPPSAGQAGSSNDSTITTRALQKSGSTLVIGGTHSRSKIQNFSGIPVLMDIPIIGALFRSRSKSESQSEMMTMITPTILSNVENDADSGNGSVSVLEGGGNSSPAPGNSSTIESLPADQGGQGNSNASNVSKNNQAMNPANNASNPSSNSNVVNGVNNSKIVYNNSQEEEIDSSDEENFENDVVD